MELSPDKVVEPSGSDLLSKAKFPMGGFRRGPEVAELGRRAKVRTPHLQAEAEKKGADPTLAPGSYNNGYYTYTGMLWRNFLPHGEGKKVFQKRATYAYGCEETGKFWYGLPTGTKITGECERNEYQRSLQHRESRVVIVTSRTSIESSSSPRESSQNTQHSRKRSVDSFTTIWGDTYTGETKSILGFKIPHGSGQWNYLDGAEKKGTFYWGDPRWK